MSTARTTDTPTPRTTDTEDDMTTESVTAEDQVAEDQVGTATDTEEPATATDPTETAADKSGPAEPEQAPEVRDGEIGSGTGPDTPERTRRRRNPVRLLRAAPGGVVRAVGGAGRAVSGRMSAASRRTRLIVLGVLAALVVCAGAGVGVLAWQDSSATATDSAAAAALDAARTKLPLVLSYKYATLDADLGTARQQITGPFATQFDQLAAATIVPSTRDQKITTTATVVRDAVISATPGRVETLLFVNQSTTSAAKPQPQATASQVRVVMTPVAGQWLISEVTPI